MDFNFINIFAQTKAMKPKQPYNNWDIATQQQKSILDKQSAAMDPKAVADWQKAGAVAKTSAASLGSILGNSVPAQLKANVLSNAFSNIWGKVSGFFK